MENSIENNLNKFFDQITENVKKERKARNISQLALSNILDHKSCVYVAKIAVGLSFRL